MRKLNPGSVGGFAYGHPGNWVEIRLSSWLLVLGFVICSEPSRGSGGPCPSQPSATSSGPCWAHIPGQFESLMTLHLAVSMLWPTGRELWLSRQPVSYWAFRFLWKRKFTEARLGHPEISSSTQAWPELALPSAAHWRGRRDTLLSSSHLEEQWQHQVTLSSQPHSLHGKMITKLSAKHHEERNGHG